MYIPSATGVCLHVCLLLCCAFAVPTKHFTFEVSVHLSTGHLSAWPNFSGSEESTREGLLLCVFVCVYVRTRVLLWVFPPCLSNRKLMWSSTEDREKAFSFHCESFEREREREKKMKKEWRGKKRDQAAALIQPSAIWPASLSVPLSFHSLYLSVYLSFFCVCVCVWSFSDSRWTAVFWRDSGVYGEFTSPVRRLGEGVALWVGVHILPVQL